MSLQQSELSSVFVEMTKNLKKTFEVSEKL